jgi:hypothetical protein
MGIEPTCRAVHARHSDFEDRGHHQVCKHFQKNIKLRAAKTGGDLVQRRRRAQCASGFDVLLRPIQLRFVHHAMFVIAEQAADDFPAGL